MDAVAVRRILAADAGGRLATYGTLRPGEPNVSVLESYGGSFVAGSVVGERTRDGWRGYPGLTADGGDTVPVSLLTEARIDWNEVDDFEGPGYRRRRMVVSTEQGPLLSNVYVLA